MPRPLRLHDDGAGIDMRFVEGRLLGERGDVGFLPQRLDDTVALLADLHRSGVGVPRRRTTTKIVASLGRKFDGVAHEVVGRLAATGAAPRRGARGVARRLLAAQRADR